MISDHPKQESLPEVIFRYSAVAGPKQKIFEAASRVRNVVQRITCNQTPNYGDSRSDKAEQYQYPLNAEEVSRVTALSKNFPSTLGHMDRGEGEEGTARHFFVLQIRPGMQTSERQ